MLNKEQAKEKLKNLVKDFKNNPDYYTKLSEADVEDKLVNELFVNILGWDKKDYEKRAKARRGDKGGSADYAFKINDRIVFFLEVKKVTIPLDKEADEQVILYSLSKKVPLAISTNFQQMNIFCVEQENAIQNVFRNFKTPDDYVNNFQDLLFLSKESFEQGLLLKKAEDEGRLKRRVYIDKVLLEDFWRVRTLIANDIEKNKPGKYNINEKDEIVQRILDRLIFIRRCEDIGINPENLTLEEIKHVAESRAYSQLKALFTKYDSVYNSGLFTPNKDNDCDIITIDGSIIQKLISYLYESHDKKYKYNFEWIDADVLGQVYEQYLGKILAQTKSGKAKLKEGQAHRKEQGIYYTPTYIVDYIVKNTLGELLKDKKVDALKIKILDPACGSGSFLIKAFDYMQHHLSQNEEAKQHKLDFQGPYSVKTDILKNNIFGVDLDNKAVEITKLNLLLKAAEKFRKLPSELDNHIGWGNSLIDDNAFEHPFKWIGDFQEGTFDVVIGNPPYVNVYLMDEKERKFFGETSTYQTPHLKYDLYTLFIEKGIKLLQNKGHLGFIIPYSVLTQPYAELLRKYILDNCSILSIVDLSSYYVFQEASVKTVILVLRKEDNKTVRNKNKIKVIKQESFTGTIDSKNICSIDQSNFLTTHQYMFRLMINKKTQSITDKMDGVSVSLGSVCYISKGIVAYSKVDSRTKDDFLHSKKINSKCVPYLEGKNVEKYMIDYKGLYLEYDSAIMSRPTFPELHEKSKILVRAMSGSLVSTFDDKGFYADQKLICCPKRTMIDKYVIASKKSKIPLADNADNYNEKYIVGLLNSSLMWYYYKSLIFGGLSIHPEDIRNLPIKKINFSDSEQLKMHNYLVNRVDKMLSLNKQLQEMGNKKTAQTSKLEEEIKKTDEEINDLVYKLYNITEEEKKIIEESLK